MEGWIRSKTVRVSVAGEAARIRGAAVSNRRAPVGSDNIHVEIHYPLAGNTSDLASYTVRRVAGRAGESVVQVAAMLAKAGVGKNRGQIMALRA